jgi:hypothetical protein
VKNCVIRIEAEGPAIFADGAVQIALPSEGYAEVAMSNSVIRIEIQGRAKLADGAVQVALLSEADAEGDVRCDIWRFVSWKGRSVFRRARAKQGCSAG